MFDPLRKVGSFGRSGLVLLAFGLSPPLLCACAPGGVEETDASLIEDAARGDAAPPGSRPCTEDRFGPPRPVATAHALGPGDHPALVLCGPAVDRFRVDLPPEGWLEVQARGDGALSLTLRTEAGEVGRVVDERDPAVRVDGVAGAVWIEVDSVERPVRYGLRVIVGAAPCAADEGIGAEGITEGTPTLGAGPTVGRLCRRESWFRLDGTPGAATTVRVDLEPDDSGAPSAVGVSAWAHLDPMLRLGHAESVAGRPATLVVVMQVATPTILSLEIPAAALGRVVRVQTDIAAVSPDAVPSEWRGRVIAVDREVGPAGVAGPRAMAGGGLRVDLLDGADRSVAAAWADEVGDFALTALAEPGATRRVMVSSEAHAAGHVVRVGPGSGDRPWSVATQVVADAPPPMVTIDLFDAFAEPGGELVAAAHIALVAAEGLRRVAPWLPGSNPRETGATRPVRYRWRPGARAGCGTCFRPGVSAEIELSGEPDDPDEWDDAVILHELGHDLAARYSADDSPGGRHDGDRLAPAVAWSEGWATFFAAWVLGTPRLHDARAADVLVLDLENLNRPEAFGTSTGGLEGDVSEHLVAAVLWAITGAAAGAGDPEPDAQRARVSADAHFRALFEVLPSRRHDYGALGIDLVDFLTALECGPWQALVERTLAEREFPRPPGLCASDESQ